MFANALARPRDADETNGVEIVHADVPPGLCDLCRRRNVVAADLWQSGGVAWRVCCVRPDPPCRARVESTLMD